MGCVTCNAPLRDGAKFCNACGAPQATGQSKVSTPPVSPPSPSSEVTIFRTVLTGIGTLLTIIWIVRMGYFAFVRPVVPVAGQTERPAAVSEAPSETAPVAAPIQADLQNDLDAEATEASKSLPTMVGNEYELVKIESAGLTWHLTYVIVETGKTMDQSVEGLKKNQQRLGARACSDPDTRARLDKGVNIQFTYLDGEGRTIGNHLVTPAMCQ